jgi:hypothetical protein
MRSWRVKAVAVAAVAGMVTAGGAAASAGVAGASSPTPRAPAARPAPPPDVTVLFGRALRKVRATHRPLFSRARVFEADGSTADRRPTSSASGINRWRFVFDNTASHSKYLSATLTYRAGRLRTVVGIKQPFLEDVAISKAPTMTLATAVKRLRGAGYKRSFRFVTLRRPLGPRTVNTLYLFGLSNGTDVAVDTVTGRVSKVLTG